MSEAVLGSALLVFGCWSLKSALGDNDVLARVLVCTVVITAGGYYCWWRLTETLPCAPALSLEFLFPWVFFVFETSRSLNDAFVWATLTRRSNRSPVADTYEPWLRSLGGQAPAVDVFIPTYNEKRDILLRTIVGAKALDYPNFRIFVLDDTARDWLRRLCAREQVYYVARRNGADVKAGNLNHALALTRTMDPAPFILCLDADFVPFRQILYRTLGFFFYDERIAIVQTPQVFFNPDPPQMNLLASQCWVDEQRFFFDVLQESMDAFDHAFCVGTSYVLRREAVEHAGGFPSGSVVEDIHLTFSLMAKDWKTRYLNEPLSNGLAAESIGEFVAQRARWAIGCTQALFLTYGPLHRNNLRLGQRLRYFSIALYWVNITFMLLAMLAAPLYWFYGVRTVDSNIEDLALHFLPYYTTSLFYFIWVGQRRIMPFLSEAMVLVFMPSVVRAVFCTLCKITLPRFHVTAKGIGNNRKTINWRLLGNLVPLFVLNLVAPLVGQLPEYRGSESSHGDMVNLIWSAIDVVLLLLAMLLCIEVPRQRRHERFVVREEVTAYDGSSMFTARISDLSVVGVNLLFSRTPPDRLAITWRGIGPLLAERVHTDTDGASYRFRLPDELFRRLSVEIYTGGFRSCPAQASPGKLWTSVLWRIFVWRNS